MIFICVNVNKNRYNRKKLSDLEVNKLVLKYKNSRQYTSLFSDKVFDSENKWRNDVIRHLDVDSCNKFFWSIEPVLPKCITCQRYLTLDQYSYGARELGFKGFKKYCSSCERGGLWRYYNRSELQKKRISRGLKRWAKTIKGQKYYKIRGCENSKFMKRFSHTTDGIQIRNAAKIKQSKTMREKIAKGEFTPNITNSWTHWTAKVNIHGKVKSFRSSWEACFAVCHPNLEYETIRIPYGQKIYIADFYDSNLRILYEIKPIATYNTQVEKISKVILYCLNHNIKFVWINEHNILKYIDQTMFKGYNKRQLDKMMNSICKN